MKNGTSVRDQDPLAMARLRGIEAKRRILTDDGGILSAERVGEILTISRQAVEKRRKVGPLRMSFPHECEVCRHQQDPGCTFWARENRISLTIAKNSGRNFGNRQSPPVSISFNFTTRARNS